MTILKLSSYRKKGINAYLKGVDSDQYLYGSPATPEDQQQAYKSKLHTISIDLSQLVDGMYVYKEAGGADFNKIRYGWIKIKAGEIIDEGQGNPPPQTLNQYPELPELLGSPKQIAWAEKIRLEALDWNYKHGFEFIDSDISKLPPSAKWWIDNRSNAHDKVAEIIGFHLTTQDRERAYE